MILLSFLYFVFSFYVKYFACFCQGDLVQWAAGQLTKRQTMPKVIQFAAKRTQLSSNYRRLLI